MKHRFFFTLLILFFFLLSSCTSTEVSPSAVPSPTMTPVPEIIVYPDPSPEPTPTDQLNEVDQPAETTRTLYVLDTILDYDRHHLSVDETIRYTNHTGEPLSELVLMVEPQNYPGVFSLTTLKWVDGAIIEGFSWDKNRLTLPLPLPMNPGDRIEIKITFELNLPMPIPSTEMRPVPFGYSDRQTNLVDWYPFIAPYVPGKGWLAHPASYYGEHLVYESADFEINLRFESPRDGLIVAASSVNLANSENNVFPYQYRLKSARNFALSISDQYQVFSQSIDGITILSYTFPFHAAAGESALQTTINAVQLFSDLLIPYPYQTLSVVEADFLDGMEYTGLFFLSNGFYNLHNGSPADYLTAIAAHETAHQWWYGLVGNDQALEPWLDEALCTYSEHLYYQKFHPEVLDWWWAYRVNYYEPSGWVDTTIYNPEGSQTPYRSYRNAVYLNGAKFIADLRELTGDTDFFSFIQDYTSYFKDQIATGDDFFTILEKHTLKDISPLLAQYFKNR